MHLYIYINYPYLTCTYAGYTYLDFAKRGVNLMVVQLVNPETDFNTTVERWFWFLWVLWICIRFGRFEEE